jgi:hypothetical protein
MTSHIGGNAAGVARPELDLPITVTKDCDNITRPAGTNHLFVQMGVYQHGVAFRRGAVKRVFELVEEWIWDSKPPTPGELPVED